MHRERESIRTKNETNVSQLRWNRADLAGYRAFTGSFLQPINADLIKLKSDKGNNAASKLNMETIDNIYGNIVDLLRSSSDSMIPKYKKNFSNIGGTIAWMN